MALKLDTWHRVLVIENCQDCSNSNHGLTLTYDKVKYCKMLEQKISWKVSKIFIQEGSNGYIGLTLRFPLSRSNLLSGLLYGNILWILVYKLILLHK